MVAYKRIQGGIQADVSLRVTSNFIWKKLFLELRPHGCASEKRLPFRVEVKHGSKVWTERCTGCVVQPWQHKDYTSIRVQFCREYYGVRLRFLAHVGKLSATTATPIIIVKPGQSLRYILTTL